MSVWTAFGGALLAVLIGMGRLAAAGKRLGVVVTNAVADHVISRAIRDIDTETLVGAIKWCAMWDARPSSRP